MAHLSAFTVGEKLDPNALFRLHLTLTVRSKPVLNEELGLGILLGTGALGRDNGPNQQVLRRSQALAWMHPTCEEALRFWL